MNSVQRLNIYLTQESKAYGYTLCIWGSGAVLMTTFELLPRVVLLYVTGAVIGFGILAAVAYRGFFKNITPQDEETVIVASMIHFLAALGTVGLAYFFTHLDSASIAFFLAGINATVTYNVLMLAEALLSEQIQQLEDFLQAQMPHHTNSANE